MNKLKELREELGLTVRKLEEYVNISYMTLNNYENENRTINPTALIELAKFYDVTTDYVLGLEESFVYVNYEKNNKKYMVKEALYKYLKKRNYIFYKDNIRYIDFNSYFNIDKVYDVSFLIDTMYYNQDFSKILNESMKDKEITMNELSKILNPKIIEISAYMLTKLEESLKDN